MQTPSPQQNNSRLESFVQALFSETFKKILLVIPLCTTFITLRVISSVGDTYFNEQATSMESISFEAVIIPFYVYESAKVIFNLLYFKMANYFSLIGEKSKLYVSLIGIAISMVLAIPCCIVAAIVEKKRLNVAETHGLVRSNKEVPMNMVWVVPQYLLLAGLDGISSECITHFFEDQLPIFSRRIAKHLELAISGLGSLVNVLVVHLIRCSPGKEGWFKETINDSRLDKYFWLLSEIAAANLFLFFMLAVWYVYKDTDPHNAINNISIDRDALTIDSISASHSQGLYITNIKEGAKE